MNHGVMPVGYLLRFLQRLFRAGISGMWPYSRRDELIAFPAPDEGLYLREEFGPHIEDHAGYESSQAHLPCSLGRLIRKVVHVRVAGDAEANQLQTAKFHAPTDVFCRQPGFQWPDLLPQPGHQLHIIRVATQESHGQVSVTIDEPGNGQFSPAVDDVIPFFAFFVPQIFADLRDPAVNYENITAVQHLSRLENGDVSYQHRRKFVRRDIKIVERKLPGGMVSSGLRSTDPKMGGGLR